MTQLQTSFAVPAARGWIVDATNPTSGARLELIVVASSEAKARVAAFNQLEDARHDTTQWFLSVRR